MIKENKVSKYMIYAIGEIVLVVIGILIAISINNWNTGEREIKELYGYFNNISKNVQSDLVSVKEIKIFRESSISSSQKFLEILNKETLIHTDFAEFMGYGNNVFYDRYFQSNKSGFEALKNSGYLGKLHGTILEEKLYEYYQIIDKIAEREESLNDFIESMEVKCFEENIAQQIIEIMQVSDQDRYFKKNQKRIQKLFNHPSLTGANMRNAVVFILPEYYNQLIKLGEDIVTEIDNFKK